MHSFGMAWDHSPEWGEDFQEPKETPSLDELYQSLSSYNNISSDIQSFTIPEKLYAHINQMIDGFTASITSTNQFGSSHASFNGVPILIGKDDHITITMKQLNNITTVDNLLSNEVPMINTSNQIPILVHVNGDGDESRVVELIFDDELHNLPVRLYLNYNPNLPAGKLFYDYFGDGEMYFNAGQGKMLSNARQALKLLYANYFLSETSDLKIPPTSLSTKVGSLATAHESPNSDPSMPFYGWMFELDLFFDTESIVKNQNVTEAETVGITNIDGVNTMIQLGGKNNNHIEKDVIEHAMKIAKKFKLPVLEKAIPFSGDILEPIPAEELIMEDIKHPVCKYFSYVHNDFEIISNEYNFANHIPGLATCSSPRMKKSDTVIHCGWSLSEQPNCTMYGSSEETITKVSISPKNTSYSFEVELSHYITGQKKEFFRIINKTEDVLVNTISVPEEISFEDALKEATSVFEEYISHYVDHNDTSNIPAETIPEKEVKSFIETLTSTTED